MGVVLGAAVAGLLWSVLGGRDGLADTASVGASAPIEDPVSGRAQAEVAERADDPGRRVVETPPESAAASAPVEGDRPTGVSAAAACRITGRVVDLRGVGVPRAKVALADLEDRAPAFLAGMPRELLDAELRGVETTEDGAFAIGLPKLGAFELVVQHERHPTARQAGEARAAALDGVVVVMRDGAEISGVVLGIPPGVDAVTVVARTVVGKPALGLPALAIDVGSLLDSVGAVVGARKAAVDLADGSFHLGGLDPDASFSIWATRDGGDAELPSRCTARADVRAGAHGVELRWKAMADVAFQVVDADSGAPIERLDVAAGLARRISVFGTSIDVPMRMPIAQTEFPDGRVHIEDIDVDGGASDPRFGVEVHAAGYRPWKQDDVVVPPQGRVDLGVVRLTRAAIVHVTVIEAASRAPVAGATVTLQTIAAPAEDSSSSGGSVSFSHRVTTSDTDMGSSVRRTSGADPRTATTDANGGCELTVETDGEVRIAVTSTFHAPFVGAAFMPPARGSVEAQAALSIGGSVRVLALDGHGAVLEPAAVERKGPADGDQEAGECGPDGEVLFEHLAPGVHEFRLAGEGRRSGGLQVTIGGAAKGGEPDVTRVEVGDGELVTIELREALRGNLRGTVTLGGVPLDRAVVRLVARDGGAADAAVDELVGTVFGALLGAGVDTGRVETGPDGAFEMLGVVVGARRLIVTHASLAMPSGVDVDLVEGDNRSDVDLRVSVVRGRVIDGDGKPLSGAGVEIAIAAAGELSAERIAGAREFLGEMFGAGASGGVRTGADGTFELRGVQSGRPLVVRASARMCVPAGVPIGVVEAGATRDGVEVRLAPAGRIRIQTSLDGVLAAKVRWAGAEPAPEGAVERNAMVKSGRATLDGLLPGSWLVELDGDDTVAARARPQTVLVKAGETVRVEF